MEFKDPLSDVQRPTGEDSNLSASSKQHISPTSDSRHDAAGKQLQATLSRKRRRNELAPVSRLPIEVLGEIFDYLRDMYEYDSFLLWIPEATHVCHAWREVALHTPLLWNVINVTASPLWALEFALRSKNVPLHITVSNSEADVPMEPICDCAEQLVRASVERVQTIFLDNLLYHSSEHHLRVLSSRDSPNECVTFPILSHLEVATLDTFILTDNTLCAPLLKSLVVRNFCLVDWKAFSLLKNLSYLEINPFADLPGADLGDIHKALCQMSNLTELTFHTENSDIGPEEIVLPAAPIQPALLPKLRRIHVGAYSPIWLSTFLHCVASGPQRDLSISARCYSANDVGEMFSNFPLIMQHVEQSSIRSLCVEIFPSFFYIRGWRSVEKDPVGHEASITISIAIPRTLFSYPWLHALLLNGSLRRVHFQHLTLLSLKLPEPVPTKTWVQHFGCLPNLLMVDIRLGLRKLCAALVNDMGTPDDSHCIPFRALRSITVEEEKGPYSDEDIDYMRRCLQKRLNLKVPLKELHIMFEDEKDDGGALQNLMEFVVGSQSSETNL